jgi:hypothetical protein
MNNPLLLLAEVSPAPGIIELILRPETLVFLIPIAAIVGGIAYKITTAIIAHRERMARIEHGLDPSEPPGGR